MATPKGANRPGPDGDRGTGRSGDRLADRSLRCPHPSRLPPDHPVRGRILAAHDAALAAGDPGYLDPVTGLFVLTAGFLARRGNCCGRGCRHCPYLEDPPASDVEGPVESDVKG